MMRIGSFSRLLPVLVASLVILIGIFTLTFRAPVAIGSDDFQVVNDSQPAALIRQVNDVDQEQLPKSWPWAPRHRGYTL